MKKFIIIIGTLTLFFCKPCFAQLTKKIRASKERPGNLNAANNLGAVKITLSIDTVQKETDNGIRFSIELKNDSAVDLQIRNPLDYLTISLINSRGKNICFPGISRVLVNDRSGNKHVNRKLVIEKVTKDKKIVNENIDDSDTITLPQKSVCELFLSIKQVLKPNAVGPYTDDQEMKIVPGYYTLSFFISIIENGTVSPVKNRFNEIFQIAPIKIDYGH